MRPSTAVSQALAEFAAAGFAASRSKAQGAADEADKGKRKGAQMTRGGGSNVPPSTPGKGQQMSPEIRNDPQKRYAAVKELAKGFFRKK